MKRVLVIFGTRPEAIKMAPVVRALQQYPDRFTVRTCATAQHREMLDQVLDVFGISPDIDLDLMQPDQSLSGLAAKVLATLDSVLLMEKPDWVLVQGDTTTVMAAALAAQHRQVQVGHVEAGLRTYDRRNPFPEEMNRVVADHISDLCFAPTETARENLLREGIDETRIIVTGNTVLDALLTIARQPWTPKDNDPLAAIPADRVWLLVTAHRRENFGVPLNDICKALRRIADERGGHCQIIYPVHRNPNVWLPVHAMLSGHPAITLLPPVDYRSLVYLMQHCRLILTDSGGLQEEAPTLNKPVLVMRTTTERPEAVTAGAAQLVGTQPKNIIREVYRLLDDEVAYQKMALAQNPYGDGRAAERIVQALLQATENVADAIDRRFVALVEGVSGKR
ncbi:MAG: UDP-N-acetylglucosamine 2-epimerase (non-hydrolyzing) [Anaerolinea sp.]|nr:UDP-N-acetylglucosamine 2-epimerase (non-hydrolyzing) [Anaerolinea sp.]